MGPSSMVRSMWSGCPLWWSHLRLARLSALVARGLRVPSLDRCLGRFGATAGLSGSPELRLAEHVAGP
eukprot:3655418-Pyramimonas_sp.AAC.1